MFCRRQALTMKMYAELNDFDNIDNNKLLKTISVPQQLLVSMVEAQKKWEEFSDEFEDFLLSLDKRFIEKMERAREEHLKGNVRDLQELKRELF